MALLTIDRKANILLMTIPSLVVSELFYLVGIGCCWTLFFSIWGISAVVYLVACLQKLPTQDKAVLVTGCDSGFGYRTALRLHDIGFTVFAACLLADKNGEGAAKLKDMKSDRMFVLQLNVASQEEARQARQIVDDVLSANPSLKFWGIINNAGIGTFGEMEWVPLSMAKRVADVNVFGMINVIQIFVPLIRRSKGRIINVASMLGRMAAPMRSTYGLTKFAVGGLSDSLRQELIDWGVKVIVVEPGNFIAGTSIYTEESIAKLGEEMWASMSEETRSFYGEETFKNRVEIMKTYVTAGDNDITPVVDAFEDALLQKFPQWRYQPMDLYYKTRVFCAWHLPEYIYDFIYMGPLNK